MGKKVSVIIPVYNCEKYLSACLESLLHQTYNNLEIILIDDGSSDRSSFICDEYGGQYSKIKVIHQENAGPGMARNTGIDVMTGDYLTFVDSDDYVAKEYIETLMNLLEKYHADIAEVGLVCMYPFRNAFENSDGRIRCFEGRETLIKDYFSENRQIRNCIAGRMYDTTKINGVRFSEKSIGEDSEYSLKMLSRCERLVKYHKCLYVCRAYQETLTRRPMTSKHFDVVDILFRDISFAEQSGVKFEDWTYVFQCYVNMCYDLLGILAVQKKEKDFASELENIILVYWEINKLAEKHNIKLSTKIVEDIEHIDLWAHEYRKKNRIRIIIAQFKAMVSRIAGIFKEKISYEYQFEN